jgi:hypothetical protein
MGVFESEKVQQTIAETKVLSELLSCMDQMLPCQEARGQIQSILEGHQPTDAESWLKHCAMAKIVGEPVAFPEDLVAEKTVTAQLFLQSSRTWALWAAGKIQEAQAMYSGLGTLAHREGHQIHLMALGPWCYGVEALIHGEVLEARRFFRRSMELGSQFGTDTNNAIQWAYVATFFFG